MVPAVASPFLSFLDLLRIIQGMFLGRKRRHNFFFVVSILTKTAVQTGEPGLNKKQKKPVIFWAHNVAIKKMALGCFCYSMDYTPQKYGDYFINHDKNSY